MKKFIPFLFVMLLFTNCSNPIKNEHATITVEAGVDFSSKNPIEKNEVLQENPLYGFWVGYFKKNIPDDEQWTKEDIYVDEGYVWQRENKINISIDKIEGETITGHSIVAGNHRSFKGSIKKEKNSYYVEAKEPGDNKYDGTFTFYITDSVLEGTWKAFQKIEIQERKYTLKKKAFVYNPNINLERAKSYINWEKEKKEGYSTIFPSATDLIYQLNASNTLLSKEQVENMKKGDLLIVRNTIYARHGYSFKKRTLRVFFDAQSWYIPVFTDIKSEFTQLEKKNIELLLRYEKNASEYYDYFGRG